MESQVQDIIEIKGRVAVEYGATGVVAVLNTRGHCDEPECGKPILIVRPDGWMMRARMGEVKKHGDHGYGIFISNLTRQDVPIGASIRWGMDFWPSASEEHAALSPLVRT